MSAFTDKDLERLKEHGPEWELPSYEVLAALLARLKAAEEIVKRPCAKECDNCYCKVNREAWRKSKVETE
jgi:hypothetical protein